MRTSMIGAALFVAGAGAAGLAAAADTNGNNLKLNGSDTLFEVTTEVIHLCNGHNSDNTGGNTYLGGGSGVGAGQMSGAGTALANQAVSPMSRAMKNTEFCAITFGTPPAPVTAYSSGPVPASQGASEGLLVGIDGVSIAANQANSCSGTSVVPSSGANGFGPTSMQVLAGGTGTAGATYTFGTGIYPGQPSFDALAVLYFGLTNDGVYNCASDTRKTLIAHWKSLFSTDCSAGDNTCTTADHNLTPNTKGGLTHAWRRSDLSGTTDAFVSVLNPPGRGIGTLSNVPVGAAQKINPFCNSVDANAGTTSFGGSADFSDKDPVRTICGLSNAVDDVCESYKFGKTAGLNQGDLGVVLPVLIPDASVTGTGDLFPVPACSAQNFCTNVAPIKSSFLDANYRCPGSGAPPNLGFCLMPTIDNVGNDPRCISNYQNHCFDVVGKPDGRQYNLPVIVNNSQFVAPYGLYKAAGTTWQFAIDVNIRPMTGSFYRIHAHTPGEHNVVVAGTTGTCQEHDDTSQIGCLVDSDPCSIGFAGREDAQLFPGTGSPLTPVSAPLKALAVNGVPPFTPDAVAIASTSIYATGLANPDLALQDLVAPVGNLPLYPLARRLYFNTIYGASHLQGGEDELARCYGTNSITNTAISDNGFVPVPGGVTCVDYPQERPTSSPAPNVQGSGNAALGGCLAAAGTGTDACTATPFHDITGAVVPEAMETFTTP